MKPVGLAAGTVAVLLSVAAPVASAAVDLESLLRVALNEGDSALRWGLAQDDIQQLFGEDAKNSASVALIPMPGTGLIAIGSADGNRFFPGMGTLFLRLMGETFVAALQRFRDK